MKPKVFISQLVPDKVEQYIAKHCEYSMWKRNEKISKSELLAEASGCHGILGAGMAMDREMLEQSPQLRAVSAISVGYNHIDISAYIDKNVIVTHTPYVLDDTVADLVISLMLATARRIPELDQLVKKGEWEKGTDQHLFGLDVHHKVLGIIGMGRIGEAVAKRAKWGFDMEVLYYNRHRNQQAEDKLGVVYSDLEPLLEQSDFVVLIVPLTPQTENLIGSKEFQSMKKTAIFINASRGQTVDEHALVEALQTGQIYGAGLDVYQQEPIEKDHPLLKLPNVVTLPHIGSATAETRELMAMTAAESLVKVLHGEMPRTVIPEIIQKQIMSTYADQN